LRLTFLFFFLAISILFYGGLCFPVRSGRSLLSFALTPDIQKKTEGTQGRKVKEYLVAWQVAVELKRRLEQKGISVILTKDKRRRRNNQLQTEPGSPTAGKRNCFCGCTAMREQAGEPPPIIPAAAGHGWGGHTVQLYG